jgi:hypothetical protein
VYVGCATLTSGWEARRRGCARGEQAGRERSCKRSESGWECGKNERMGQVNSGYVSKNLGIDGLAWRRGGSGFSLASTFPFKARLPRHLHLHLHLLRRWGGAKTTFLNCNNSSSAALVTARCQFPPSRHRRPSERNRQRCLSVLHSSSIQF